MSNGQDLTYLRDWMSKQPHLPQDLDDILITQFFNNCMESLERTKKYIDRFCSTRSFLSEFFTSRDPLSPNLETALSVTVLSRYKYEENEIVIHKYEDPTYEKYVFNDFLKTTTIYCDYWLRFQPFLADEYFIILDVKYFSLKMIPKMNMMLLKHYVMYLVGSMPIRIKKILIVNAPSFYDKLYAMAQPALPATVCNRIYFFTEYQSLHKIIDKKYLPKEYDGEAQSMYEKNREQLNRIVQERKMFLNDNLWKAYMIKKPTNGDDAFSGSFRVLSID